MTKALLATDKPTRKQIVELTQALPPTGVSIVALHKAAADAAHSEDMQLLNAKFVRRELAARRAYGLSMLMRAEETLGRPRQCELWDEIAAQG